MSEYKKQDSIYEIEGEIKGEITLGHIDILMRYLKRCLSSDSDETREMMKRLQKVDARLWGKVVGHPDLSTIIDAFTLKAGLGIVSLSKEQREWFKMLQARAGQTYNVNRPGAKQEHNLIISVKPLPGDSGVSGWVDPKDGSLPPHMKKGIPGLDDSMEKPQ